MCFVVILHLCIFSILHLGYNERLVLFGDAEGKMSYIDLGPPEKWEHAICHDKISIGCSSSSNVDKFKGGDDEEDEPYAIHLLPNILIGTGKYCRSCKYHDKAVDTAHLTDNGYLITASAGNVFWLNIFVTLDFKAVLM